MYQFVGHNCDTKQAITQKRVGLFDKFKKHFDAECLPFVIKDISLLDSSSQNITWTANFNRQFRWYLKAFVNLDVGYIETINDHVTKDFINNV